MCLYTVVAGILIRHVCGNTFIILQPLHYPDTPNSCSKTFPDPTVQRAAEEHLHAGKGLRQVIASETKINALKKVVSNKKSFKVHGHVEVPPRCGIVKATSSVRSRSEKSTNLTTVSCRFESCIRSRMRVFSRLKRIGIY